MSSKRTERETVFFYFQKRGRENMAINKVIYGGETLIDLTGDTVTADKILSGFTAHDKGWGADHRYL